MNIKRVLISVKRDYRTSKLNSFFGTNILGEREMLVGAGHIDPIQGADTVLAELRVDHLLMRHATPRPPTIYSILLPCTFDRYRIYSHTNTQTNKNLCFFLCLVIIDD